MIEDALKLTAHFGARDRAGGGLLADALIDVCERHAVRASALFGGIEGFGIKHRLQTERLLTLSEDLPMVVVAVDARERMEAVLDEVRELNLNGVTAVEQAQLITGDDWPATLADGARTIKLTIHLGRQERAGGRPAHLAVVDRLHRLGVAGATVLLGLDGTAHGVRRRGRFLARNGEVPMMVVSVGESDRIARALPELSRMLSRPLMSVERTRVLKRDGMLLADARGPSAVETAGGASMERLTVYVGEQARYQREPLHGAVIRALRREGAAGATALRGVWGYHGEHRPHGERLWSVRRHVPVVTVLLDTPANIGRWFEIVDEMTPDTGLVTRETVPTVWSRLPPTDL